MRIFSVNGYTHNQQKSFKGEIKYLNTTRPYGGDAMVNESRYTSTAIHADQDYSSVVKNRPHATVEKTLNTYHGGQTREIYYADPKEEIPISLKERVDYVVYDNEPPYPKAEGEISENYFGKVRHDFSKDFDEVRDYYYRWEMAEAKKADVFRRNILADYDVDHSKQEYDKLKNNINIAKYQQWQAERCKEIYNEGIGLRHIKETAENDVVRIERSISDLKRDVATEKSNIEFYSKLLVDREKESEWLNANLKEYKKIAKNNELLEGMNANFRSDEKRSLAFNQLLNETETLAEKLEGIKKSLKETIQKSKIFVAQAPEKLKELASQKATKEALIEETKGKLIPLFDKLKNFYNVQQIIRR